MKNYIFGTGPYAINIAKMLDKYGIKIDGFLKIGEQKGDAINIYIRTCH